MAARAPDGETSKGSFQLPFTNDQLEAAVRTLGYTRAATTRDIGEVTTERRLTAEQLGGELADALLIGPTGDLYTPARSAAIAKGRGVRLTLSLRQAPSCSAFRGNCSTVARPSSPANADAHRAIPRHRRRRSAAPDRRHGSAILGVVASPSGLPALDVATNASASRPP